MTPALEYSEVVEEPRLSDAAFKLFDGDNQMVLLRPEMTTPIARLVAQRLRDSPTPHKLSYAPAGLPAGRRRAAARAPSSTRRASRSSAPRAPPKTPGPSPCWWTRCESVGLRAGSGLLGGARTDRLLRGVRPAGGPRGRPASCSSRSPAKTWFGWTRSPRSSPPRRLGCGRFRVSSAPPRTAPSSRRPSGTQRPPARPTAALENLREILDHLDALRALWGRDAGPRPDRTPQLLHRRGLRGLRLRAGLHRRERRTLRQPAPPLRRAAPGDRLRHLAGAPDLRPAARGAAAAVAPRRRLRRSDQGRRGRFAPAAFPCSHLTDDLPQDAAVELRARGRRRLGLLRAGSRMATQARSGRRGRRVHAGVAGERGQKVLS